jgi:hypothetical protein
MEEKHMPNDINNQDTVSGRIEKALLFTELLSRYRELFDQNEPLETVITDVVTDLLHIAATADPDCVDDVLSKARVHFESELGGR